MCVRHHPLCLTVGSNIGEPRAVRTGGSTSDPSSIQSNADVARSGGHVPTCNVRSDTARQMESIQAHMLDAGLDLIPLGDPLMDLPEDALRIALCNREHFRLGLCKRVTRVPAVTA